MLHRLSGCLLRTSIPYRPAAPHASPRPRLEVLTCPLRQSPERKADERIEAARGGFQALARL